MNEPQTPTPTPAQTHTPQQKLIASRQALLDAMGFVPVVSEATGQATLERAAASQPRAPSQRLPLLDRLPASLREHVALQWFGRWWRNHPAHDVVDLGRPYLEDYARRHPGKLIAYSAGAGSLLWLTKPWRLLPVAALLSLTLRSGTRSLVKAAVLRGRGPRV